MTTAFDQFWQLLKGALTLNFEAFELINTLPYGSTEVLLVVLAAGLSRAIAQSIILFINRVKPARFILCLLIAAVLFTFSYFFWVFSTWLVSRTLFATNASISTVARVLGFSYAPILFSFLGALPYFGVPIFQLLSLWSLLAVIVGFSAVTNLSVRQAFECVVLGWFVLQLLEQTIGKPLGAIGRSLANMAAGVQLVTERQRLLEIVRTRWRQFFTLPTSGDRARYFKAGAKRVLSAAAKLQKSGMKDQGAAIATSSDFQRNATAAPLTSKPVRKSRNSLSRELKQLLSLLTIGGIAFAVSVFLSPIAKLLLASNKYLQGKFELVFDLLWIGLIALIVAGLLAPFEALGWWAGWYGEQIDTTQNSATSVKQQTAQTKISRYAIYLDGIGQSSDKYLPDIEEFLDQLAAVLPDDLLLIRGLMPYSVLNRPLTEDRALSFFWNWASRLQRKNPASWVGFLINIRNILVVAVAADQRYGPIYNQGTAQVMYDSLLKSGYKAGSGVPITLIGFSGGAQIAMGALPLLKRALAAPIEVISLGGAISGNVYALALEHLYHLVGEKDPVERLATMMFPKRWSIFFLSYWNRAKRRGKISFISLGPVGHELPGGLMDPDEYLTDGRSHLQQTIDWVIGILKGELLIAQLPHISQLSNYERYQLSKFNRPDYYPLNQLVSPDLYQPLAAWMGRLILPKFEQRLTVKGVLFEVYHADAAYQHLVGQVVNLRWSDDSEVQAYVRAVTKDVHFSAEAEYARTKGLIVPERLNHWRQVNPLESLAGARPNDDVIVMLREGVRVEEGKPNSNATAIYISREPVQISGRFYGLVKFLQPLKGSDHFRVVHYNRASRQFDGVEEVVLLPQPIADNNGIYPSTSKGIEKSPLNATGWYIYGAKDRSGKFVVQAIAPRALHSLKPQRVIFGEQAAFDYIKKQSWQEINTKKGQIQSVLLSPQQQEVEQAISQWQEGDRALVLHVYGGIGGKKKEPAAKSPLYFGHFAYGLARVVREKLTDELRFDIEYHQVYTHNTEGLVAGTLAWCNYMGDRQWGLLGIRPVCDLLIKLDAFTQDFDFDGKKRSAISLTIRQLEVMTARYRIGDGTGATFVGPANNCAQDANQALYASFKRLEVGIQSNTDYLQEWRSRYPEQGKRFAQLVQLEKSLKRELVPFGIARSDWENNEYTLGSSLEDQPLKNLFTGLVSWRTILPRLASDTVVKNFLQQGAVVWVLRTNQVGGFDSDIEPIAPMTI